MDIIIGITGRNIDLGLDHPHLITTIGAHLEVDMVADHLQLHTGKN